MPVRVLTWNLQGREQPDLDVVVDVIRSFGPSVVALQEVRRGQARRLASAVGWQYRWVFKHWPVIARPEGMAICAPAIEDVSTRVLAQRWQFWSWRRRVALAATVDGVRVVNLHLGSQVGDDERARQARIALGLASDGPALVVGDFNAVPGSTVFRVFADAGFVDAWQGARGETNWEPGPRDAAPTQRLDYVMGLAVAFERVQVPTFGDGGFDRYPPLSDHLPVIADGVVVSAGRG